MASNKSKWVEDFKCPKCGHMGAQTEQVAMAGTGMSRFLDIQHHSYAFVSCSYCGYTEVYNLRMLKDLD